MTWTGVVGEPEAADTAGSPDDSDPTAPWGRKADGSPKDKPGRKPGQKTGTGRRRGRSAGPAEQPEGTPAPPPPRAARKPTGGSKRTDYATSLNGVVQMVAMPLGIAGQRNPQLLADAAAVATHGPNIAAALDDLANEKPEVARVLDKILTVGPYGALMTAVLPLVFQLGANHRVLPAGLLGSVPPEVLTGVPVDAPAPQPEAAAA
jgi:hypothetical protein